MKLSHLLMRSVSGAFILQSGIGKLGLSGDAAAGLRDFAATGVPALAKLSPDNFGKFISYSEIAVGGALLTPFISDRLAGVALGAFSGGLLSIYFRNDALTQSDGIRPSEDGLSISKDVFMALIAASLMLDGSEKKSKK